jgi:hypothetical protein
MKVPNLVEMEAKILDFPQVAYQSSGEINA